MAVTHADVSVTNPTAADSTAADSVGADSVGADSVGADSVGADLVGASAVGDVALTGSTLTADAPSIATVDVPADASADVSGEMDDFLGGASFEDPQTASEQAAADAELDRIMEASTRPGAGAPRYDLPNLGAGQEFGATVSPIDLLRDVELNVKIELGRAKMLVEDVLRLGEGSVVELDKLAGDPVDVFVNERLVARGEVLVLNDNFCVRVNEIVASTKDELA